MHVLNDVPNNSIMFCMDVTQLYPGVPNKEGIEACEAALSNNSHIFSDRYDKVGIEK